MHFGTIWYRSTPRKSLRSVLAWEDIGTLELRYDALHFLSNNRSLYIPFSAITCIEYVKHGNDRVNGWIRVETFDSNSVYFAYGRWLGWLGFLGGTRDLYKQYAIPTFERWRGKSHF